MTQSFSREYFQTAYLVYQNLKNKGQSIKESKGQNENRSSKRFSWFE